MHTQIAWRQQFQNAPPSGTKKSVTKGLLSGGPGSTSKTLRGASVSCWCTACPEEFSGFLMIGYRHRSLRQSSVQLTHFQICFLAVPSYFSGGTSTSIAWFKPWEAPPNRAMWAIVVSMPHQEARKFPNTWGHDWNLMVPKMHPISPWFLE